MGNGASEVQISNYPRNHISIWHSIGHFRSLLHLEANLWLDISEVLSISWITWDNSGLLSWFNHQIRGFMIWGTKTLLLMKEYSWWNRKKDIKPVHLDKYFNPSIQHLTPLSCSQYRLVHVFNGVYTEIRIAFKCVYVFLALFELYVKSLVKWFTPFT